VFGSFGEVGKRCLIMFTKRKNRRVPMYALMQHRGDFCKIIRCSEQKPRSLLLTAWNNYPSIYMGVKSLALPSSRCILFDGENIPFEASINIPLIMIINRIYEHQNFLPL